MRKSSLIFALSVITTAAAAEVRVVDGDTIKLDGVNHRIFGIDAPEHGQKCNRANGKQWRCGKAATSAMRDLVDGKAVTCEVHLYDDFDRPVSTCHAGDVDVGEAMVRKGLAWAFIKYETPFVAIEADARREKIGVWEATSQAPWDFRSARWEAAEQDVPPNVDPRCRIKGNISDRGKIYHAPWSYSYEATRINTAKGERWFCTEKEALDAGWRAPLWGS